MSKGRYICFQRGVRVGAIAIAVALAGAAAAQSYGSFNPATAIFGVDVSNTGLSYTVTLDPGAYLIFNSTHYDITDIFGFWSVSPVNPLNASGTSQNGWNFNSSDSSGHIAGWHNPSKSFDIQPGNSLTFTYTALNQQNIDQFGFHLTLAQTFNGGNTAFFRGPLNPVPEPASIACVGVGAVVLLKRRRSRG